ncbi:hypothetical protein WJX73_001260 [Symbiochloris irregularis]|uniref:Glutathione S-transferase n=1 Tax=Symbiochloris irregularis TaxID=706552 RepID=A0AAW1P8N9_9CHLO
MPEDPNQVYPHATGGAHTTCQRHQQEAELVLNGSWFCPFVQRTWIVLEEKKLPYQWNEVNPYKKDPAYLAKNPKGLRALGRMMMDHIAKKIVAVFFRLQQAQETEKQKAAEKDLLAGITDFVQAMDPEGPFFFGDWFSMVDIMLAPWLFHTPTAFKQFKGFEIPFSGSPIFDRFGKWADACSKRQSVLDTTSHLEHYLQILKKFANDTMVSVAAKETREGKLFT